MAARPRPECCDMTVMRLALRVAPVESVEVQVSAGQLDDRHRHVDLGPDGVVLAALARWALLGIPQPIVPVHHQRLGDEWIPPLEHRGHRPVDPDQRPVVDEELQVLVEETGATVAVGRSPRTPRSADPGGTGRRRPTGRRCRRRRRRPRCCVGARASTTGHRHRPGGCRTCRARRDGRSQRGDTAHGPPSRSPSLGADTSDPGSTGSPPLAGGVGPQ